MKTIYMWFCELPEGYRQRAMSNLVNAEVRVATPAGALGAGFTWKASPEGEDFWVDVHEVLQGKKLNYPPLPEDMKKFKLSDCPQNENGHWLAVDSCGDTIIIYTDKGPDPERPFIGYDAELATLSGEDINDGLCFLSADELSPAKKTVKKYLYLLEDGSVRVNTCKLPENQSCMCYLRIVSRSEVEFEVQ